MNEGREYSGLTEQEMKKGEKVKRKKKTRGSALTKQTGGGGCRETANREKVGRPLGFRLSRKGIMRHIASDGGREVWGKEQTYSFTEVAGGLWKKREWIREGKSKVTGVARCKGIVVGPSEAAGRRGGRGKKRRYERTLIIISGIVVNDMSQTSLKKIKSDKG